VNELVPNATEKYLATSPDPVEVANKLIPKLKKTLELVKTPEQANDVRTMFDMAKAYLKQQLPKAVSNRIEQYRLMHPAEVGYIEAAAKAGAIWIEEPNKSLVGNPNWADPPNSVSVEEFGFRDRRDATRCKRAAELHPEDLRTYFELAEQNLDSVTLNGVEQKWHMLHPHIGYNSGEDEWYTPEEYVILARKTMGSINLDPASSDEANKIIKADNYFTAEKNGLKQKWFGNVWLNPPYSQPLMSQFAETTVDKFKNKEFKQACILTNNATETNWCQQFLDVALVVCLIKSRVKFIASDSVFKSKGFKFATPLQGQIIFYLGEYKDKFAENFKEKGVILWKTQD
jgi:phage N-6-adenine-methyltransferase